MNRIVLNVLFIIVCAFMAPVISRAETADSLYMELRKYVDGCGAQVGVAVIADSRDTVCVNGDMRCPLNSVMKLYQAVAVASVLEESGVKLDSVLHVGRDELRPDTWSPMRDRYGCADLRISIAELMEYSLRESDNNACDILFSHIVGVDSAEARVKRFVSGGFAMEADERMMHESPGRAADNWTYPPVAASLINRLFTERLFGGDYQDFIKRTLAGCLTGERRLAGALPDGVRIAHKTGTGFDDPHGCPQGVNDVGFIVMPDGRHYSIAVFVKRTGSDLQSTERLIAEISAIVLKHLERH